MHSGKPLHGGSVHLCARLSHETLRMNRVVAVIAVAAAAEDAAFDVRTVADTAVLLQ